MPGVGLVLLHFVQVHHAAGADRGEEREKEDGRRPGHHKLGSTLRI